MTIRLSSLKKITDLKGRMTQIASGEYAESLQGLQSEQMKLQELIDSHDQAVAELHNLTASSVSAQELHSWMLYVNSQRMLIEKQMLSLKKAEGECEVKRELLTERFVDEQKWTRMQDTRMSEHRTFVERVMQEALDEVAVTGYQKERG